MPTNQQIAAAREQGTIADAMMEEFLVGQQQQPPPLPPQNTAGMANLYTAAFGVDNQAPAAMQDPPAVDSRTGQRAATTTAASDGPIQRVITDAHARTVRPANQQGHGRSFGSGGGCGRGGGHGRDGGIPDELDDGSEEHEEPLWDDAVAIEHDTRHVLRCASGGITSLLPNTTICIRSTWKMSGVMNRYINLNYNISSSPTSSICIRSNWTMPAVMNRYTKYE
jgi:hypothetical protein